MTVMVYKDGTTLKIDAETRVDWMIVEEEDLAAALEDGWRLTPKADAKPKKRAKAKPKADAKPKKRAKAKPKADAKAKTEQ